MSMIHKSWLHKQTEDFFELACCCRGQPSHLWLEDTQEALEELVALLNEVESEFQKRPSLALKRLLSRLEVLRTEMVNGKPRRNRRSINHD